MPDPVALLRSKSYLVLLILAALIGIPVSAAAYFFLALVSKLQGWIFTSLPQAVGFHSEPLWWPIPPLLLAGVLVALTIRYLPGTGGHSPADGFKVGGGPPIGIELPGVVLAALATLSLGVVLGPEAPLIALGGGLGAIAVRLAKRDAPARTQVVMAAAGSFAAISTLLGSPLTGAFLLMEASGLGGSMMELVLLPGLVAAGVGSLMFVGLDAWTGLGTFSLAIPGLPHVGAPTGVEFLWALAIGLLAVGIGSGIRWFAFFVRPYVERRRVLITPVVGLAIAGLAIAFEAATGKGSSEVLFSGQSALGPFVSNSASYTVGALLLLLACKGVAYGVSLGAFRGGPIFPALFIGAVGGDALSHLPGLPPVAGIAMGIGAMSVVMLRLPLTSVLLASLLLASDGLVVMPLVIVAVVVAFVASARLTPSSPPETTTSVPEPAQPARVRVIAGFDLTLPLGHNASEGRSMSQIPTTASPFDSLPTRQRRRLVFGALLRSIATVGVVVAIYFLAPMDRKASVASVTELVIAVLAILALMAWQIRQIIRSGHPGIRAVEGLAFSVPLYILMFATAYFLMNHVQPATFGGHLSRTDAMYFSTTVFTTVGFGDIVAKSEVGRLVVTFQMVLDLVILGVVARVVVNAIKIGQQRYAD